MWDRQSIGYLVDAPFPCLKHELYDYCIIIGVPNYVLELLSDLSDEEKYEDIEDICGDIFDFDDLAFRGEDEFIVD